MIRRAQLVLPTLFIMLLAVACSDPHRITSSSQLLVTNGIKVEQEDAYTKPVVMLQRLTLDDEGSLTYKGYCTASFVNDTTALTAAHCVLDGKGAELRPIISVNGAYTQALSVFYPEAARKGWSQYRAINIEIDRLEKQILAQDPGCDQDAPIVKPLVDQIKKLQSQKPDMASLPDVAVIVFPKGTGFALTGGKNFYSVSRQADQQKGDRIKFIGFGPSNMLAIPVEKSCHFVPVEFDHSVKHIGTNVIESINSNVIYVNGFWNVEQAAGKGAALGEYAGVGLHDSGSPIIACRNAESCDSHELIAVTSQMNVHEEAVGMLGFKGASLASDAARELFKYAVYCQSLDPTKPCAAGFPGAQALPLNKSAE